MMRFFSAAVALACSVWCIDAAALTCAGPPAVVVVYPNSAKPVPRDAVLFVWERTRQKLSLVERKTGKEVWLRFGRIKGSALVRLVPAKPLRANTAYAIRIAVGPRVNEHRVLRTFRTDEKLHGSFPSAFQKASISFSPPTPRRQVSMYRLAGRSATLALEAQPEPAVVEMRFRFTGGRKKRAWTAVFPFSPTGFSVATTSPCDFRRPPAPARGRYEIVLIPWSPSGHQGRKLVLSGPVR